MAVAGKKPWFKFYPQDWRGDAKLRSCSIGARGLWAEMLCIMHEALPYGYLLLGAVPVSNRQLASLAGISQKEALTFLAELGSADVFSRDERGVILSRRMVRDHERAQKGRDDANKRWGIGDDDGKPIGHPIGVNSRPPITPEARVQIDDDETARAAPLVSREARDLADELLLIAGHRLEFVPPGWCGAAMRVQAWLAEWPRAVILIAVRAAAARKRGAPANNVQYFENAVAEEFARQSAPLPIVEIKQADKLTVTHGTAQKSGSLIAAIDRQLAAIEAEAGNDFALSENPVRRISG